MSLPFIGHRIFITVVEIPLWIFSGPRVLFFQEVEVHAFVRPLMNNSFWDSRKNNVM